MDLVTTLFWWGKSLSIFFSEEMKSIQEKKIPRTTHRKCKESVCMVQLEDPISQPRPELSSIWRSVVWEEIERIQEHGIWIQHTGVSLRSSSSCNSILSPLAPKGINIMLPLPLSLWHIVRLNLILCFKELGQICHPVADNLDFSLTAVQLIYLLASELRKFLLLFYLKQPYPIV
jgi:hypothetical protein